MLVQSEQKRRLKGLKGIGVLKGPARVLQYPKSQTFIRLLYKETAAVTHRVLAFTFGDTLSLRTRTTGSLFQTR